MKNLEKFLQKLLNVVWPQVRTVQRIISTVAMACVAHDASLPEFDAIGIGGDAASGVLQRLWLCQLRLRATCRMI